jgi:hypothetical protein
MTGDAQIDLAAELAAAREHLPSFADRIRARVSAAIWNAPAPVIGVMNCEFDGDFWRPWAHEHHLSGGTLAVLIAVRAVDDQDFDIAHPLPRWAALHGPEIIDIVAMPLAAPRRWARRTGLARILGRIPFMEPRAATRVYGTPAGWLSGDGAGISLLERDRAQHAVGLQSLTGGIVADAARHGRELAEIAARPLRAPRLWHAA